ncbi:MAG: hypothetical protein ICV78_01695 [Tolypothrix sp. Co-bin9]|nr:hypothetical protein [Tolypothrix sp. Co-bin9]
MKSATPKFLSVSCWRSRNAPSYRRPVMGEPCHRQTSVRFAIASLRDAPRTQMVSPSCPIELKSF